MAEETTAPAKKAKTVAITKSQRMTAAAVDLIDLCNSAVSDGVITPEEVEELRRWVTENEDVDLPARRFLAETIERVLEDGRITTEEQDELFRAVERVLPPEWREVARGNRARYRDATKVIRGHIADLEKQDRQTRNAPVDRLDFMVAGVRYEGRWKTVESRVRSDMPVIFQREPTNLHSRNAVLVTLEDGAVLGYVPEDIAVFISPALELGYSVEAFVKKVLTGGAYPIPVIVGDIYRPDADSATTPHAGSSSWMDVQYGPRPIPSIPTQSADLRDATGAAQMLPGVGVSHYQEALTAAGGADLARDGAARCPAFLIPEPQHPVGVEVLRVVACSGETLGYFGPAFAKVYAGVSAVLAERGLAAVVDVLVARTELVPPLRLAVALARPGDCLQRLGKVGA